MEDAYLILGSKKDWKNANVILEVWRDVSMTHWVGIASSHRHGDNDFADFIRGIKERLIVFIGGQSLAAPGLIETINKKAEKWDCFVFGVPTDKAARSAIEDLPKGTAIITCGLNETSLESGLVNSALVTAKLAARLSGNLLIIPGLIKWHYQNLKENPLTPVVELDENGLIPEPGPKN